MRFVRNESTEPCLSRLDPDGRLTRILKSQPIDIIGRASTVDDLLSGHGASVSLIIDCELPLDATLADGRLPCGEDG